MFALASLALAIFTIGVWIRSHFVTTIYKFDVQPQPVTKQVLPNVSDKIIGQPAKLLIIDDGRISYRTVKAGHH
jgi:hypothetical protein